MTGCAKRSWVFALGAESRSKKQEGFRSIVGGDVSPCLMSALLISMRALIAYGGAVAAVISICGVCRTALGGSPDRSGPRDAPVINEEFEFAGGGSKPVLIPIEFAGRRFVGALDTGSTVTVFDNQLRPHLGPVTDVRRTSSPTGKIHVEQFRAPKFYIGRTRLDAGPGTVACADLEPVRRFCAEPVLAAVGMDVLRNQVIRVDFIDGRISFLARSLPKRPSGIPLRYFGSTPWIAGAASPTASAWFQLDTGWGGRPSLGNVSPQLFRFLRAHGSLVPIDRLFVAPGGGTSKRRSGTLTVPFIIAGYRYDSARFDEGDYCSLGLPFISQYVVTFDFPNDRVYFDPPGGPFFTFGLRTAWRREHLVAASVAKGSRADDIGLLKGDVIISVNGIEATFSMEQQLRREAEDTGKALTLTVLRRRRLLDLSFAPRWPVASPGNAPTRTLNAE